MVIYVVSDTHGHVDGFLDKIGEIGKPDKIFFLGDYIEDVKVIEDNLEVETIAVKGNNDFMNTEYKNEELLDINGIKIFLTHGHMYDVSFDINNLYYRGEELGADLVFFGHTHRPTKITDNNITILNPGSVSFPRTMDRKKTFIKLLIDNGFKYEFIEVK